MNGEGPRILGIHLEGPSSRPDVSASSPGAPGSDPVLGGCSIGPDPTLTAPELEGADELIDLLLRRGVTVSCTGRATADEANAAFDRGVRTVTHLFNAMRPLRHRDPGSRAQLW